MSRFGRTGEETHTLKELSFELAEGEPASPTIHFLVTRPSMRAHVEAMRWTGDTIWELTYVAGPAKDLAEFRRVLEQPPRAPVLETHVLEEDAQGILYYTRWNRPADASQGVSIEHLMLDLVGPEAVLDLSIQHGRMSFRVVGPDGGRLLDFFTRVKEALDSQFTVRLHRVGELRGKLQAAQQAMPESQIRFDEQALLREALLRGYYDNPKKCGVRELGDALGFSKSVVARKLRALERRALETFATGESAASPLLRGR